ncbi:MAG: hypothetical protein M1827_003256 [Pycnora praestabilis]|nr:MAG: hypothetical protein M1827_003256 [Pycnora praestabilis]
MLSRYLIISITVTAAFINRACAATSSASASTCSTTLTSKATPSVASGYEARVVATGLTNPRGILFDTNGHLLVVQQGVGVLSIGLHDDGGACVSVSQTKTVIDATALNHGIALSSNGKTLYASSAEAAYSWEYDPTAISVGSSNQTIVSGMSTNDHTTRTLLLSQKVNGTLLVSRGSTENIDPAAELLSSGHSQVKAFDLENITSAGYDFDTDGMRLGWGLRNSVGVSEEPLTGGIYTVENSVDDFMRDGQDIHQNNPGEEMNFLGYLNGTEVAQQGENFGYPTCFAAWDPSGIPDNSNLTVGSPFSIGTQNSTVNDTICASSTVPPRLTFQAHMAPLDILFDSNGTEAWVTFHGSWDRTDPVGYKLSMIPFSDGSPVAAADNNTATIDILANANNSMCPDSCFRPVGLAWDSQGRLFMSSDATGEIYVIAKTNSTSSSGGASSTGSAPAASTTKKSSAEQPLAQLLTLILTLAACLYVIF